MNSYPAGSPGVPDSGMPTGAPGLIPRRSSYASVVSGAASSVYTPQRSGGFAHLVNPPLDLSYDPTHQYHQNYPNSRFDSRAYDMDFNTNGSGPGQIGSWSRGGPLPSLSSAFGSLANGYGGWGGGIMDHFFIPSYLKDSKYAQKLEEAYKTKVLSHKEGPSPHSSQPGSLSTSASSISLHSKMVPSHRGMTYDIIEKAPPLEEEILPPLPSRWNSQDKYGGLEVMSEGQEVKFTGVKSTSDRDHEACAIRADHPMPPQCGIYYFEVTIISRRREESSIGIGFSAQSVSLSRLPGWEPDSWAYHGDDGHSFCCQNTGKSYGPPFTAGDVIGCGVNFRTRSAFFTRNGVYLGTAFREIKGKLFPSIGMKKTGEHIRVNFGQSPFVFDIDGAMTADAPGPDEERRSTFPPTDGGRDQIDGTAAELPSRGERARMRQLADLASVSQIYRSPNSGTPGLIYPPNELGSDGEGRSPFPPALVAADGWESVAPRSHGDIRQISQASRAAARDQLPTITNTVYTSGLEGGRRGRMWSGDVDRERLIRAADEDLEPSQGNRSGSPQNYPRSPPPQLTPQRSSSRQSADAAVSQATVRTATREQRARLYDNSNIAAFGRYVISLDGAIGRSPRRAFPGPRTDTHDPDRVDAMSRVMLGQMFGPRSAHSSPSSSPLNSWTDISDRDVQEEKRQIHLQIEGTCTSKLAPKLNETELIQQLVLQFLQHDGYVETARAFAEEVHAEKKALSLDPDAVIDGFDVQEDEDAGHRQRIRIAILEGDVERALKHTKAYYPHVLKDNEHVNFRFKCLRFVELIRQGAELLNKMNSPTSNGKKTNGHYHASHYDEYVNNGMELEDQTSDWDDRMDTGESNTQADYDKLVVTTLDYGQGLQAEYKDDPRREVTKALADVFSLMAYPDPYNAKEVKHLLDLSGRVAVAEELNSAILLSLGKSSSAALEQLCQQTTILLEDLRDGGGPGAFVNIDDYVNPNKTSL